MRVSDHRRRRGGPLLRTRHEWDRASSGPRARPPRIAEESFIRGTRDHRLLWPWTQRAGPPLTPISRARLLWGTAVAFECAEDAAISSSVPSDGCATELAGAYGSRATTIVTVVVRRSRASTAILADADGTRSDASRSGDVHERRRSNPRVVPQFDSAFGFGRLRGDSPVVLVDRATRS